MNDVGFLIEVPTSFRSIEKLKKKMAIFLGIFTRMWRLVRGTHERKRAGTPDFFLDRHEKIFFHYEKSKNSPFEAKILRFCNILNRFGAIEILTIRFNLFLNFFI